MTLSVDRRAVSIACPYVAVLLALASALSAALLIEKRRRAMGIAYSHVAVLSLRYPCLIRVDPWPTIFPRRLVLIPAIYSHRGRPPSLNSGILRRFVPFL